MSYIWFRKTLFWMTLIIGLLVAGGCASGEDANSAQANTPEAVAMNFTRAFYTVDYRDKAVWLAALKPLMTPDGVVMLEQMTAPALWPKLTQAQIVTTAVDVTDKGIEAENPARRWQIRKLTATVTPRWPMMTLDTVTVYLLLEQEATDQQWRGVTFLSENDVATWKAK